ncbi:hypothetical protein AVEN_58428-1 [Araneus ventricosus]|uniref:Uncharacterized protein n=1 Tax=Araneus ventricosus TaxID=182803 RepID=A0A4Y2N1S3_ARAVE|nr:hypothetical protein AVEN_58428-1 [Araneus ventricosus]
MGNFWTDLIILNCGQETMTSLQRSPLLQTSTPRSGEDVWPTTSDLACPRPPYPVLQVIPRSYFETGSNIFLVMMSVLKFMYLVDFLIMHSYLKVLKMHCKIKFILDWADSRPASTLLSTTPATSLLRGSQTLLKYCMKISETDHKTLAGFILFVDNIFL